MPARNKECFHCGQPVPLNIDYNVKINGKDEPMCCLGCQAVANAIVKQGLLDYYQYRSDLPQKPEELIPEVLSRFAVYDRAEVQKSFVHHNNDNHRQASLILEGLVCAACAWLSEQHVLRLPGVLEFKVNYTTHRAFLIWDESRIKLSVVLKAITDIGFIAHPFDPQRQQDLHQQKRRLMLRRLIVAGLGTMQVMMMAISIYLGAVESPVIHKFLRWMSWLVATPVVFYSASLFFTSAWRDLKSFSLGMDVPVSLAILLAYFASVWAILTDSGEIYFDSVTMFSFFLLVGRFLEQGARQRAGQVMDSMVRLTPAIASRKTGTGIEEIPVTDLQKDDIVLIRPGAQVPADGVVAEGISTVDESMLTGESLPIGKNPGDKLTGGATNFESPLFMRVRQIGQDTVLSAILRLLERAQSERPSVAKLADRVAAYFVFFVLLLALLAGVYWWHQAPEQALWIVISMLVVTCPCALSLATPVAVTVASSRLAQEGLLTTRAHALETLAKVSDVVFDKTGTLTAGQLKLLKIDNFSDFSDNEIKALVSALESASEHPLAKALSISGCEINAREIKVTPGRGITGKIDGVTYRIGKLDFVKPSAPDITHPANITVFLSDGHQLLACLHLTDTIRADAEVAIAELKKNEINVHLYSGDKQTTTNYIAEKFNINDAKGDMLPQDKLSALQKLQKKNKIVVMIGDGVNDAPVLAGADVSMAMGQGTALARISSDMVLLSNQLAHIPHGIKIAQAMMRIIKQNISWAIVYNIIAVPLALMGYVRPWMAAVGMSLSSLIVVINALRLKKTGTKL